MIFGNITNYCKGVKIFPINRNVLTSGGLSSMLLMLLFGIPLYICATASTSIAAALLLQGLAIKPLLGIFRGWLPGKHDCKCSLFGYRSGHDHDGHGFPDGHENDADQEQTEE